MRNHHGVLAGIPWWGKLVERPEDLRPFLQWVTDKASANETVCFDLETWGLQIYRHGPEFVRLAQFGTETEAWVIPVEHGPQFMGAASHALRTLPSLTGHNLICFDALVADKHMGVPLEDLCKKSYDTQNTAKLIDSRAEKYGGVGHSLKGQSAWLIDPSAPDTQEGLTAVFKSLKVGHTKKNPVGWNLIPWNHPIYVVYGMFDVILGSRLKNKHEQEMRRRGTRLALVPYELELSRIAATMIQAGMLVDAPYSERLHGEFGATAEKYLAVAAGYGVENVNSDNQVREALLGMGESWRVFTDTGNLSVSAKALLPMADLTSNWERIGARTPNPLADAVLRAKRAGKWRTTYVDRFLSAHAADGRIHPNIQTLEARTGRMSITGDLAAQTLPSGDWSIRRGLMAEEGHRIVACDFSAVEMRVLAALADVSKMKEAIAAGRDLHDFTAELVYGPSFTKPQRTICKRIGLGQIFGAGLDTLVEQTGAPREQVAAAKKTYNRIYPEIKAASDRWQRMAFDNRMTTVTATGRRLQLDRDRTYAVVNYQCQSAARDVLGKALLRMDAAGLLPYLRLPIHDEVVASVPESEVREVAHEIEKCMRFELKGVPIHADADICGRTWGSKYMVNAKGKLDPDLMIKHDPYWAAHPEEAYAAAA